MVDVVVSERIMVIYYFDVSVILVVVMSFSILNLLIFNINLVVFYEKFVLSVGVLVLRIFWVNEDGYVVIENSVSYYVICEKGVLLF